MQLVLFWGKRLDVSWYGVYPWGQLQSRRGNVKLTVSPRPRLETSSVVCHRYAITWCFICMLLALHFILQGLEPMPRVRFPRAKTAPGGQTKPNGCIVFLVLVSCSGQRRCDVWGFKCVSMEWTKSFIVRQKYISVLSQLHLGVLTNCCSQKPPWQSLQKFP